MKVVKQRDIRGFHATYRDNGVGACSFYACSFYFLDDERELWLTASVFDAPGYVAVNSGNLSQKWNAAEFEPALREAIRLVLANEGVDSRLGRE